MRKSKLYFAKDFGIVTTCFHQNFILLNPKKIVENKLTFDGHIEKMSRKSGQKSHAAPLISKLLHNYKKRFLIPSQNTN